MTSRFTFVASSALLASLLVVAVGCSDVVDVPVEGEGGDGSGSDGGDGGDDGGDLPDVGPGSNGLSDCPSNVRAQNVCQPDVPEVSVAEDCDFGVADSQCKAAEPKAAVAGECPNGVADGLCNPVPPALSNWTCPAGTSPLPGLHNADKSTLSVEGVTAFTACQTAPKPSCDDGQMPLFGSPSCQPVAAIACPGVGLWPSGAQLQAAAGASNRAIVFVSPNGTGDGASTATPASLAQGLVAAANADSIVALAQGTYALTAPITIGGDSQIALVGACAGQTVLQAPASDAAAVQLAAASTLAEVTITGNSPGIAISSASVHVHNVQVLGAVNFGVSLSEGDADLTRVSIRGTRATGANAGGFGLTVSAGNALLTDVALIGNRGAGINAAGAQAGVSGTGVVVLDTLASNAGAGPGAAVAGGAELLLTQAVIANNRDAGVSAQGAGTTVSLGDTFITGTQSVSAGSLSGAAVQASTGAALSTSHLFASDNVLGVHVIGADSEATLNDSIIADPSAAGNNANANAGAGVFAEAGATAVLKGVVLLRNRGGVVQQAGELDLTDVVIAGSSGAALSAAGDAIITETTLADNGGGASFTGTGKLDLSDLRVVDTHKLGSARASALSIEGGEGTVARLVLARNDEYGVYVSGALTNFDFTDVLISDTRAVTDAGKAVHGIGFVVTDPAGAPAIGLTRGLIAHSREYGVLVSGPGPQVFLTDVSVTGTEAVDAPARSGAILFVNPAPATQAADGTLTLERTKLDDNVDSGASISGPHIELDLSDVIITNTKPSPSGAAGAGLLAQNGAVLDGTRVQLANNAHTGVAVEGTGTELTLQDLIVNDTQPVSSGGPSGEGLKVVGGSAVIDHASFLRNAAAGLWAAQAATVELRDVLFDQTQAPSGGSGVGIDVIGANLTGDRVTISNSHGLGLSAALGSQVTLNDVNISGTQAASIAGRGVEVGSGSSVELNVASITGSQDYAVLVSGPDDKTAGMLAQFPRATALPDQTKLALYDLSVHDTGGGGLAVLPGASLELDTFDIRASSGAAGLQLVEGATVTAIAGNITSNPIGVNVQGGSSIDVSKAITKTVIRGNKKDSDTQALPVPALSDVLARSGDRLTSQAIDSPR
ncbi:MAG TPA: right-handed parallel beta-helix repeat-containing protein [Polyangiaceae bacterium]|nr:right-handed parallel beta-helix repeat-containing protein [Polyangiaceae bacterium]